MSTSISSFTVFLPETHILVLPKRRNSQTNRLASSVLVTRVSSRGERPEITRAKIRNLDNFRKNMAEILGGRGLTIVLRTD